MNSVKLPDVKVNARVTQEASSKGILKSSLHFQFQRKHKVVKL